MTDRQHQPWPKASITTDAGTIDVTPTRWDHVSIDIASTNSLPANLPESTVNDSTVLDIGHDVKVRGHVHAYRTAKGWEVEHNVHARQYPNGRDLTAAQAARLRGVVAAMITGWADANPDVLIAADKADRYNAATNLLEQVEKHRAALKLLRRELRACETGKPYTQYPDLPTDR